MQSHFIPAIGKNTPRCLLLFFHGWGGDTAMLSHLSAAADVDVLLLYDYRQLSIDNKTLKKIHRYEDINVTAWSFGVWVAAYVCCQAQITPSKATAVNGTLYPVHATWGIPESVAKGTLANLNDRTRQKFALRMLGSRQALARFLQQTQSQQRSTAVLADELNNLYQAFAQHGTPTNCFQQAIIGKQDRIFPPAAQQAAWQKEKVKITALDAAHFDFYRYTTWGQLL